jgi:hypothetical protein
MATITKEYSTDVVLKTLVSTKGFSLDVLLKQLSVEKYYGVDVSIKRFNAFLPYIIDELIKRLNDTKLYSLDSTFISSRLKTYLMDFTMKKQNQTKTCFIDVFLASLFTFSYVVDRVVTESCTVAVPDWVNQSPSTDTNIWSKSKDRLTIVARLTDSEKVTLDALLGKPSKITETVYIHTVLLDSLSYEWNGDVNFSRPWKVTAEFTILDD